MNVTDAAMVQHPDILNPTSVDVKTMTNAGVVGVTVFHTLDGEKNAETGMVEPHRLDTDDHVYHADVGHLGAKSSPDALKLHALGFGTALSTTSLMLNPSEEQRADRKEMIQKKIDPKWRGFDEASVTAGAYKAEIEGHDDTHYLIRETDHRTGTRSAIWNLLQINKNNTKLFDGKYTEAKAKMNPVRCHGEEARKMDVAHYNEAVSTLGPSLRTYSPFAKGLGVMVTKLDDSVANGDTLVQCTVHRTPMDDKLGFIPPTSNVKVTEDHVVAINGGVINKAGSSVSPALTAAGFESEFSNFALYRTYFFCQLDGYSPAPPPRRVCDQVIHGGGCARTREDHTRRWRGGNRLSAGKHHDRSRSKSHMH